MFARIISSMKSNSIFFFQIRALTGGFAAEAAVDLTGGIRQLIDMSRLRNMDNSRFYKLIEVLHLYGAFIRSVPLTQLRGFFRPYLSLPIAVVQPCNPTLLPPKVCSWTMLTPLSKWWLWKLKQMTFSSVVNDTVWFGSGTPKDTVNTDREQKNGRGTEETSEYTNRYIACSNCRLFFVRFEGNSILLKTPKDDFFFSWNSIFGQFMQIL